MKNIDVCVVGAGPVGMTCAALLADYGVRVTLVETRTVAGDQPRAISVVDETFRVLEQLGLADKLKAESNLDTGSRYFGLGDVLLAASKPAASKMGHPAKSQFDQPVLEQILWDKVASDDRIDFQTGVRLAAVEQDTSGVTLTVEQDGTTKRLRASWLVGCDGGRSTVRSLLGIDLTGSTQVEKWIVIDLERTEGMFEKYADFHCNAERPFVVVPGVHGRLRYEFMLLPGDDEEQVTRFDFIRSLLSPYLTITEDQVRRSAVYTAHQRLAATYRRGRAFLAGDAAHLMPPFAGQGLNAGMRDASNIAWKLAEAVRGRATQTLLDSYEAERRPNTQRMVTISHRIGQVVMTTDRRLAKARDILFRGLSLVPRTKAYLAGMRFIAPPNYLQSGCAVKPTADIDARLAALVGVAMPQPVVRDAHHRDVGLDHFINGGWSLLAIGAEEGVDPLAPLSDDWSGIVQTTVVVHPAGTSIAPGQSSRHLNVSDETGSLVLPLAPAQPTYLLVRPDKYVAAAFTPASQQDALAGIKQYLTAASFKPAWSRHG